MKKVFIGISNILLIAMMFVYLLIGCFSETPDGYSECICQITSKTGLPIIGIIFMMPAFVFSIIVLCKQGQVLTFIRNMFTLFAGIFTLASTIIALCMYYVSLVYVPVIILICSVIAVGFSAYGVIRDILKEDKAQKASKASDDSVVM